jgi:alkyldihydroxyacetonephosphate synthase
MSHHHGVGKQTAPWLVEQLGEPAMGLFSTIKNHLDPHNILNPGGSLGMDMFPEQASKTWGLNL